MSRYFLIAILLALNSCQSQDARATAYLTELEECNRTATTLCGSIACEHDVRARYSRQTRDVPASCVDAGLADGGTDAH